MTVEKRFDVVITGLSGLYPECDDVDELWTRLMNKEDMITIDGRRWVPGEFDVPPGTGKVRYPQKFDMTFFGIHRKLCEKMDPYTRLLCEQAYRSVCDAGVNPKMLDGTNTAVIMSSFASEPELDLGASLLNQGSYNVLAFSRTMQANRLSYFLNLKGPSFQLDCSGVGGILAIQTAYDLIANGSCTAAIVGSCSILHKPEASFHYQVMGRLSDDSITRSFSADAAGYARSEGCVTLFLQRKEHAKRIYANILAADVLCHGSKPQALSEFPVGRYEEFISQMYNNARVNPKDVCYVEAYGSASRTLDALELNSLTKAMMKEKRSSPLLIGSIKSNLGYTEGCSSMVSLTKVLLTLNRSIIPPNINYTAPNPDVPALVAGDMQVVTEPTPLPGTLVAVSELGVTGICSHIILSASDEDGKIKSDKGKEQPLPYLITMSGRNEEVLAKNMKNLENAGIDEEFVLLINSLYKEGIKPHVFRGYSVIGDKPNSYNMVAPAPSGNRKPVWFMYSGMGSQWPTMAKELMALPVFAKAIYKCHETLLPKGVNLLDIVTKDDPTLFDVILNSFVGIAAVQIGLTDVLKAVGIVPDGIIGHSVGELGCAYADGCLTAEQMILSAHARGRASVEAELIKGMMAAVGAGYNSIKNSLPETIEVACHNSKESCTLSGPADDMATFIAQLKAKGMFAKLVNVANIAYHSRYIKPAAPALLKYLKEIITVPLKRSSKWISSSIVESKWDSDLAQYSSAEYHTNNLLSSVLFEEASAHIPSDAIVIEIAPHGLLQAIVKRSLPQAVHIPMTSRFDSNNLMYMFGSLGKMFLAGIPVDLQAIYPSAKFPVSRGTPAISPLIDWLRDENFTIKRAMDDYDMPSPLCRFITVERGCNDFERLSAHKINDRVVLPSSFYFNHIIDTFNNVGNNDGLPIVIEKFKFLTFVETNFQSPIEIRFQLLQGTGNVVVTNFMTEELAAEGNINPIDTASIKDLNNMELVAPNGKRINSKDVHQFMKSMGLERDLTLQAVNDIVIDGQMIYGSAKWSGNIGDYLSSILSLVEFAETKFRNVLQMFKKAGEMRINLPVLSKSQPQNYTVVYNRVDKSLRCEGVKISLIECQNPGLSQAPDSEYFVAVEHPKFVPYANDTELSFKECVTICAQLVFENTALTHDSVVKVMEIGENADVHYALKDTMESMKYAGSTQLTYYATEEDFLLQGSSILIQKDMWFVLAAPPSKDTLKTLENVKNGFIFMPKQEEVSSFKVLFETKVNGVMYTLSSIRRYKRQYEIVNLKDGYLHELEKQLPKCGQIKSVDGEILKTVILWGQVDALISVDTILEDTKDLPNSHFLHYWLFHGKAPEFDLNDQDLKIQIERDVRMNISENGKWGSLRLMPADISDGKLDVARPTAFYFPISTVAEAQNLVALGLNLPDAPSEGVNDLGTFDFVDKTHMGVGNYDPNSKRFHRDNVLSWPKPSHWTNEEAASVPLLYSLASYIIHHTNNADDTDDKTIMVNRALLPLSQAIIALALYENMTVFASVYGAEEKKKLKELFPKLKDDNIYDCSTVAFFAEVVKNTNGVYKVINNFDDSQMIGPCAKCTKPLGVLIYVSQKLLNSEAAMGMLKFDDETVARGASSDIVMKSPNEVKLAIKKNLQEAISRGGVVPVCAVSYLHPSTLNVDAAHHLKLSTCKVVVSMKDGVFKPTRKLYIKDESKTHVIVEGKIQGDLCLDILEWLLKRGSQKVVVFMRQSHLSEGSALRLHSLREQYKSADVDIRPSTSLSSKANIDRFIRECPVPGLAMILFLGSGLRDKIEQFDEVVSSKVPECNIICIGKGGEGVCDRRKKNSLPAMYIRCSTATLEGVNLSQYLDDLIIDSPTIPGVVIKKCPIQSRPLHGLIADLMHVPKTEEELHQLYYQCTYKPTFIEIPTAGPRRNFTREVYPLFMVPGLRPNKLHTMASQLFPSAFEARLPDNATDIEVIAEDLAQQLSALPQNTFTLVGEDWGGILTLHIASKLEAMGKLVAVILLDATPSSILSWASGLLQNEVALIRKYLTLPAGVEFKSHLNSWEDKVQFAIEQSGLNDGEEKNLAIKCLHLLRRRLQSVVDAKPPAHKLKNKCHVVQIPSQTTENHGLQNYLRRAPVVHVKESKTVDEMIDNEVALEVNSLLLHEHKDAANPPIEEYIGLNVVKKPHWQSSLLYRVRE